GVLGVGRHGAAVAGAAGGRVAASTRCAALGRGRLEDVHRTIVGSPVAGLGYVAAPGCRTALMCCGLLGIGRAGPAVAGAALGYAPHSTRTTSIVGAGLEDVRRTIVGSPVAGLGYVADPGCRTALMCCGLL